MAADECDIEGCGRNRQTKMGYCLMHYKRIKRGSFNMAPEARPAAILHKTHPFYVAWVNMKTRCDNPKSTQYPWYGGRGVTYIPRWKEFKYFYVDMFEDWELHLTLDRIDTNRSYCKDNCRWASWKLQALNRNERGYLNVNKPA